MINHDAVKPIRRGNSAGIYAHLTGACEPVSHDNIIININKVKKVI